MAQCLHCNSDKVTRDPECRMLSQFGHTLTVSSHPAMSEKVSLSKRIKSILCRSETHFDCGRRSSGICPCSFRSVRRRMNLETTASQ